MIFGREIKVIQAKTGIGKGEYSRWWEQYMQSSQAGESLLGEWRTKRKSVFMEPKRHKKSMMHKAGAKPHMNCVPLDFIQTNGRHWIVFQMSKNKESSPNLKFWKFMRNRGR